MGKVKGCEVWEDGEVSQVSKSVGGEIEDLD